MIERACALALVALVSALLLREIGWRAAPLVGISVAIGAFSMVLPYLSELGGHIDTLTAGVGVADTVRDILKVVGIGYLSGLVAEVCRGMGEGTLASAVSLVGRAETLVIAAPYFFEVVTLGLELLR